MLNPFQIKDLHGSRVQENSAEPAASITRDLSQTGIHDSADNQPSQSKYHNGTVQLSSSDYDEIAASHPRARLTYMDDDDGEVITVSLLLGDCMCFQTYK